VDVYSRGRRIANPLPLRTTSLEGLRDDAKDGNFTHKAAGSLGNAAASRTLSSHPFHRPVKLYQTLDRLGLLRRPGSKALGPVAPARSLIPRLRGALRFQRSLSLLEYHLMGRK
jgi:hypothetical protein